VRNAGELGADAARIAVGGDSAGGTIAAAISIVATSRGLRRPAHQFLIYPGLDRRGTYPSRESFERGVPFTPATLGLVRGALSLRARRRLSARVAAARTDPEQNPTTYLLAAGFRSAVDEGKAYAGLLRAAGVDVTYDLRPTLSHAFVNLAGSSPTRAERCATGSVPSRGAPEARMKQLRSRVAVITGAASGIGRALAIELATEG